jgi:hypothetical protein
VIPVAGNTAGANGTYYRSDINIINLRDQSQLVLLFWLPQGVAGATTARRAIDIPALSGISSEDFVNEVMIGLTGIGTIEIVGANNDGTFDPNALLHATSRVWTPRPDGAAGTMSQSAPVVVADLTPSLQTVRTMFGLRRSSQFRLNVGMTNPSNTNQIFRVTVAISTGTGTDTQEFEVTLPPRSMEQRLVGGTSSGTVQVIVTDIGGGAGDWQAWGSSVDNASGDGWSQLGFASLTVE